LVGGILVIPDSLAALAFVKANDFALAGVEEPVDEAGECGAGRAATVLVLLLRFGQLLFPFYHDRSPRCERNWFVRTPLSYKVNNRSCARTQTAHCDMTQYALPKPFGAKSSIAALQSKTERKMEIDMESYIRSDDGARMIPIKPGWFVNEQVWRRFGGGVSSLSMRVTPASLPTPSEAPAR
jgi:hypothetical protein